MYLEECTHTWDFEIFPRAFFDRSGVSMVHQMNCPTPAQKDCMQRTSRRSVWIRGWISWTIQPPGIKHSKTRCHISGNPTTGISATMQSSSHGNDAGLPRYRAKAPFKSLQVESEGFTPTSTHRLMYQYPTWGSRIMVNCDCPEKYFATFVLVCGTLRR